MTNVIGAPPGRRLAEPVRRATNASGLDVASSRGGTQTIDYLRTTLVTSQVLPERHELTARIERHLTRPAARHPEHALLLRAYVRWSSCPGPAGPIEG
ncbi:hypothetical protein ACWGII_09430 [Streptomyces sp. NPDC054855]